RPEMRERDINGVGRRSGTPAGTAVIGRRKAVAKVPRRRILQPVSGTIRTPGDKRKHLFPINKNRVLFGIELISAAPAAMTGTDIAELQMRYIFRNKQPDL